MYYCYACSVLYILFMYSYCYVCSVLCILFMYSYCYVCSVLCILFVYSYCYVCSVLCILFMYSYCYVCSVLCILFVYSYCYVCSVLCILFMYSYCYIYSVLYILFSSCQLALFGYRDWVFSVLFRQLYAKCQGINRKNGALPALFLLRDNFYAVSSSLILVWTLCVRIPESPPTKVVNYVVLCTVCV
jgi:hypothetical protein